MPTAMYDHWALVLPLLPALALGQAAVSLFSAPFYLLAIGGLIAHRADAGRRLIVKILRAIGAALFFGLLAQFSMEAWARVTTVQEVYANPVSGVTFVVELVIIYALWRGRLDQVGRPLFISIAAMLAQVHFELAGASEAKLPLCVVLSGLALSSAIIAAWRGERVTGVAAALVAASMTWRLYVNAATASWRYLGYWTAEWV